MMLPLNMAPYFKRDGSLARPAGVADLNRSAEETMALYCPKCGDALAEDRETLFCERGDMYFSPRLESAYRTHFEKKTEPAPDVRWKCKIGGEWFCPCCSKKMKEEEGRIWCDACSVNLGAFVFHIVEHHPHKNSAGILR